MNVWPAPRYYHVLNMGKPEKSKPMDKEEK
jgi:hypothetical protein